MKFRFKKWLLEATVIYSIMMILISLVYVLTDDDPNFSSLRALLLAPAALLISLATLVRTDEKITAVVRWILHCVLCVAGSFLFIILPAVSDRTGSEKLVGFAGVLVIYIVVVLIIALTVSKYKKAIAEDKKYKKKF